MICHVVLYRMKPETSADDEQRLAAAAMEHLKPLPWVRNLRAGCSLEAQRNGYRVGLVMDFENAAALEAYRVDARHLHFVHQVAGPLVDEIVRFDFEW